MGPIILCARDCVYSTYWYTIVRLTAATVDVPLTLSPKPPPVFFSFRTITSANRCQSATVAIISSLLSSSSRCWLQWDHRDVIAVKLADHCSWPLLDRDLLSTDQLPRDDTDDDDDIHHAAHCKKCPYIRRGYFVASFPYFNGTTAIYECVR